MASTTNFGWQTPDDTDLVKDGAAAIRTLGSAIDTSLVDLKGGTSGQVLSKNTNTDMDFTWVTPNDADAIQNSIVDAKGDLIAASANDTPARLAVGNNGETLVADSSASTGLRWQGNFAAGKNKIINGDFAINQRSFTTSTTDNVYGFDRFQFRLVDGTVSASAQTFTAGTAPVAGYEGRNFFRLESTGQTATNAQIALQQAIEGVRTFAGQTVTLSFWAKAASGTPKLAVEINQVFGSGGSPSAVAFGYAGQVTISTSWARYSLTYNVPSISGKTLGTNNDDLLSLKIYGSAGSDFNARTNSLGIQSNTFDFWGVQLEAGSVATAFQTATGTLAGELAACQRYYWRNTPGNTYGTYNCFGLYVATDQWQGIINHPVPMRIAPTTLEYGNLATFDGVTITAAATIAITANQTTTLGTYLANTGISGRTQYRPAFLISNNNTAGYIGLSAEL